MKLYYSKTAKSLKIELCMYRFSLLRRCFGKKKSPPPVSTYVLGEFVINLSHFISKPCNLLFINYSRGYKKLISLLQSKMLQFIPFCSGTGLDSIIHVIISHLLTLSGLQCSHYISVVVFKV